MKYLFILVFVFSCASHQNIYRPVPGDSFSTIGEKNGAPHSCVDISDHKYCKWSSTSPIYFFKDNKLVSILNEPSVDYESKISRECLSDGQKLENKYKPVPGNKKLNAKSLEWKIQFQKIEKILIASGIQLEESKQKLEISFGRKDLSEHSDRHYLNFKAVAGEEELWSLKVSTIVEHMDFNSSLPLLLLASYDLINSPTNTTDVMTFSERSLQVIGFRHFLQTK